MPIRNILLVAFLFLMTTGQLGFSQEATTDFQPLFNGQNLDGWVFVNTPPETWTVRDQMLICSGKPIGEIRTTRMFQNFVLELEWRHMKPKGNAGVFVWADDITARGVPFHRSIEVQVLENDYGNTRNYTTHGDIFPIHGAKMTPKNGRGGSRAFPTENRSKPSPEWNHYRIECRDGSISLAVNGKVVTRGSACSPSKGYICLESEGGIVHYRNVRIQVLPDSPVDKKDIAVANRGFRSIYTGLNLNGWKVAKNEASNWQASDWTLRSRGEGMHTIETIDRHVDIGFICDFKSEHPVALTICGINIVIGSDYALTRKGWNRVEGSFASGKAVLSINGKDASELIDSAAIPKSSPIQLMPHGDADFANVYVRELRKLK